MPHPGTGGEKSEKVTQLHKIRKLWSIGQKSCNLTYTPKLFIVLMAKHLSIGNNSLSHDIVYEVIIKDTFNICLRHEG